MKPAEYWIDHLQLAQHPEGGFYKETYRSSEFVSSHALPQRFTGERCFSTSIYFLLRSQDRSAFHRIKSDELWHYHAGASLTIYILDKETLIQKRLGPDLDKGESLQVIVPANLWFGALVNGPGAYTLSGCTVAPGFDFRDFEMAKRDHLLKEFPQHRDIVNRLTS